MLACVLSALRLCVWLSNNGYIQLLYMNERFLFTFWTEQGEILQFRVNSYFYSGFIMAYRTTNPTFLFHQDYPMT